MSPGFSLADFLSIWRILNQWENRICFPHSLLYLSTVLKSVKSDTNFFSFRSFTTSLLLLLNLHICYRQGESSDINEKETAAVFNGLLESDLSISELPSNIGRRKLIKEYLEGKIPSLQTDGVKVFCSIKYS